MNDRLLRRLLAPGLLVMVLVIHHQLLQGGVLGAAQSDVVRGVWGLDHQARGLPLPLWTGRIGFPEGVKLLVLPFASSLALAPVVLLLGAVKAYNLWMLLLLWLSGLCTGLFARELTGRPASGWLAGALVISSPMLWLAITDGTPENVAFWGVPAFLLCTWRALAQGDWRFGVAAGALGFVVAADSPYHAVFTVVLAPLCLFALQRPLRPRLIAGGALAITASLGAVVLALLYTGLPVGDAPESSDVGNAIQLLAWRQWELGILSSPWEWTLTPNFIPVVVLIGCAGLALLSPLRAGPWLAAAALCLLVGLGPGQENPRILGRIVGGWVVSPLSTWADFLAAHPPPVLRFLRRLLVPAALCLGVAAELGLARWRLTHWLSPFLAVAALGVTWNMAAYPDNLPRSHPPATAACAFVADHDRDGAMLILPQTRAAERLHQRDELPVFAQLGDDVQSAAELWLQVDCQRPSMNKPTGLLTMADRIGRSEELAVLVRDLDDLTVPQTMGREIPPSATADPARKDRTVQWLVELGLTFVVVDEELYGEQGLALLREHFFADQLVEERHFGDGSGITVLVLDAEQAAPSSGSP